MTYFQGLLLVLFLSIPAAYLAELAFPTEKFGDLYLLAPLAVGVVSGIFSKSE